MIKRFRHSGLDRFFRRSDYRGIPAQSASRIQRILDALDVALRPEDMNIPGYRFHELKGKRSGTYSVTVTGNLRVTFEFAGDDATNVDLEDYH